MIQIPFNLILRFFFSHLLLSLLLTVSLSLSAQVYDGNLMLTSQADIDAFSYTEITGILSISGADINNLDGLSSLTSIEGGLFISYNPALTNIDGLSALTSVGGQLHINDNASLINIDGLASLISVGGELPPISGARFSIFISNNPLLTDLNGLSSLSSLNEISVMWVINNATLDEFCGIYTALNSGISVLEFEFILSGNLTNPTQQQIIDGGSCIFDPVAIIADLIADGTLNKGQANILNSKLSTCDLNILHNLVNAWTKAGILAQGQADALLTSAASYCSPASRMGAHRDFVLLQNYPNPAGTNTTISFTLPASGKASLKLYDASGKMVKNLMDQYLMEGTHEVKVNLQSVPAGTYFYKFQAGEYIETLPMVVE